MTDGVTKSAAVWFAAAAVMAMAGPTAAADVYKCQNAAGKVEFRDRPCDAATKAEKLDIQPNTSGTMTLEEVRAKNAAMKAKRQAAQDAEDRALAADYEARRREFVEDRAHREAVATREALQNSNAPPYTYIPGTERPVKVEIVVKPAPAAKAPPAAK